MGAEVTKRVQGTPLAKKLEVILGDVIKMPELPACDALISNTPYQISSPLIFKMLAMKNPPRVAVLMVGGIPCSLDQQLTRMFVLVSARVCKEIGGQARGCPLLQTQRQRQFLGDMQAHHGRWPGSQCRHHG